MLAAAHAIATRAALQPELDQAAKAVSVAESAMAEKVSTIEASKSEDQAAIAAEIAGPIRAASTAKASLQAAEDALGAAEKEAEAKAKAAPEAERQAVEAEEKLARLGTAVEEEEKAAERERKRHEGQYEYTGGGVEGVWSKDGYWYYVREGRSGKSQHENSSTVFV